MRILSLSLSLSLYPFFFFPDLLLSLYSHLSTSIPISELTLRLGLIHTISVTSSNPQLQSGKYQSP